MVACCVSRLRRLTWGLFVPALLTPASLPGQAAEGSDSATTRYTVPGTLVDAVPVDRPLDLLPLQPGVTTSNEGELSLRGSKAGDAAIYLDGIPVLSAFRSRPFFLLTRSRTLESQIGISPRAVQSISVTTGPLPPELGNGQGGAISIITRDGGGRIAGGLSYETDEPFGSGASVGLNRVEGNLVGSLGDRFSFFASGLLQGERTLGSGFDADAAPIFVQVRPDTTVAVPSAFGDPLADTTLVQVYDYAVSRGHCDDFAGSTEPNIANNYGQDCHGPQTPLSPLSTYQLFGKLSYGLGADSKISLLGFLTQDQNRNFDYGTLYNPAGVTGNRASSSLLALTWHQPLNRSAERSLVLDANLSFQSDRERSGPLTLEEEQGTADPFGGFLISPLDLLFDFDNFPVDEELLRNYRTNQVGSRRSPYDLENPAQYSLVDRYRNNAYGLYNRDFIGSVIFPESGGPVGPLTLYRENRVVASAKVGWRVNSANHLRLGGELTRYSMDNYFHLLESQAFSDVYLENPIRLGLFVEDQLQLGAAAIGGGLRFDWYDTRARRPVFPRISTNPAYDPANPDAFLADDTNFPPDDSHGRISPHIQASFSLTPRTTLRGGFAQQVQAPDFRLTLLGVNTDIALTSASHIFGQDLDFERTDIFELGVQHALAPSLMLDLALYSKSLKSEVRADLVSRLDPLDGVPQVLAVLTNGGTGNARGVDVRLERQGGGMLSGWLGYSYQDSKIDVESGVLGAGTLDVPAPDSRPHSVTGSAALTIPEDWKPGSSAGAILRNVGLYALFRVSSGTPYTRCFPGVEFNNIVLSPDPCLTPDPDAINASRLPAFKQLDLRLTKKFGPGNRITGYLDARNLLNFKNVLAVFAATGTTSNPQEAAINWAADSADLATEASASGALRGDGSIDLGEGQADPRPGCSDWADQAGTPAAPNCIYLIRAEERFGNGDHVFDLSEQRRASDALYRTVRGTQELTGPGRRIRIGLEASF